ncbi:nuclear transport factor 2 family protein [Spirosoma sp. KNUC1025]|uniref:nuclear transport factor 2 family protein n=1 Tax=Spirosoma sp. KNUC1025 TaxID=2894082 RepID=UPI00386362FA|nr:nuclear transport factor 2 family protein [Spirosoma sp. KNUC1025]
MKIKAITSSIARIFLVGLLASESPAVAQSTNQFTINQSKSTTMDNQATQTVKTFLSAVQQGDQQTFAALIHPDIQWNQPGTNRFSGKKTSSTAVFQMVGGMFAATANTLSLADIKQVTANGNKVACLIRWRAAQPGGGVLDVNNIDVYTVENGKIIEATVYSEDIAQEDNFWGK